MCGVGNVSQKQPVSSVTSPEAPGAPNNAAKAQQLFNQDVLTKGTSSNCVARGQPAMPNSFGNDIDGLMAQLGINDKKSGGAQYDKSQVQSVNSAAAASTAVNGSAGTDAGTSGGDSGGGSNPLSGIMNGLMQGVMGLVKNLLGGLLGGGGGGGIMSMLSGL